jgi:hypothetical protein
MPTLVTLAQAKAHLRVSDWGESPGPEDTDIQLKVNAATQMVITYIDRPDDEDWSEEIQSWDETTVPADIQAAVLFLVEYLYRFRGGDVASDVPKSPHGFLPPDVVNYLTRWRDPAVA